MINRIDSTEQSNSNSVYKLNKSEGKNTEAINNSSQAVSSKKDDKKYDSIEIKKLIDDNDKRINNFKETIKKMIVKQGEKSNLKLFGLELNVTIEDSEKAAKSISDGGEYSVDAVASRIMDMAHALSGGDDSKIGELREAVKKGFEAAGKEFSKDQDTDGLPEICNKTYNEVMKRFDEWEKQED